MHISIRRYKTKSGAELTRRVQAGFLPLIRQAEGFIAYYVVESGGDAWTSISVFETAAQAEASNTFAREWAGANVLALSGVPDVTAGPVMAHAAKTAG
ncbi:MAG TPA: hypothetical protein VG710_07255 [Opitutus sp.]|nr:hypothetical protein [Opitutus sp.]